MGVHEATRPGRRGANVLKCRGALSPLSARVRRLYEQGKPLNLSAAKRRWPALVTEIFDVRPFLGWRGLLRAAGINYTQITINLEAYCACEICGHEAGILTSHLRHAHAVSPEEYRQDYPHAEVIAEEIRARSMATSKLLLHWEPIWTPEYALDRLAEFQRRGWSLNYQEITRREPSLSGVALRAFGSWDETLRRLGLDPALIRRQKPGRTLSANEVVDRLLVRQDAAMPLNAAAVEGDDAQLANAARRCFGTYARALEAAGISARTIRLRPAAYTPVDEEEMLAETRQVASFEGSVRRRALDTLHRRWDGLVASRFRNWKQVAEKLGVPARRLRKRRFDCAEDVLEWLCEYVAEGMDLRVSALVNNDSGLYHAALRHFGTLENARNVADERRISFQNDHRKRLVDPPMVKPKPILHDKKETRFVT